VTASALVLDTETDASEIEAAASPTPASWLSRAGAFSIDVLLPIAVVATLALVALAAPQLGWLWWVFIGVGALVILAALVNRLLLPTITGFSLGRAVCAIAVRRGDGATVGFGRLLWRDIAHLLDTAALFLGWLWPLWDKRRRTFADLLLRTEVHAVEAPRRDTRRPAAIAMIALTALSAACVGLSYLVTYRHERAVDMARQQISEQGPRIVEQMLSYHKATLQQDFSHAQTLTTDSYRPMLINQQQAVQSTGGTSNEYWAVSSAVLPNPPVTTDKAAMLLAMQGQRGEDPKDLKFITATVRVDFEKSSDGQWRVANLTVLKKPQMNAASR
jgi:Mce-associated membrane protein